MWIKTYFLERGGAKLTVKDTEDKKRKLNT